MTAVSDGQHDAEILGYLGESHNDDGAPQSSMTMKTIAGDHEADLALQGRLRRQVSAPAVPHLGNQVLIQVGLNLPFLHKTTTMKVLVFLFSIFCVLFVTDMAASPKIVS